MAPYFRYTLTYVLFLCCVEGYAIGEFVPCVCVGDKDALIHNHPNAGPVLKGVLQKETCYTRNIDTIKHLTADDVQWLAVTVANETGYILNDVITLRNCDPKDQKQMVFQDAETLNNVVTHTIHNRASTIGNTAACGHSLQLWANQAPGRVLAQREKSCYGLQTTLKQTYQYAFTYCASSVSYLVDILDDQEQAFVEMLVNRHMPGERTWIGLHDVQNERVFDWTSGKPMGYVNWYSTRQAYTSASHDSEDCVALVPFHGGKWEVETCYTGNESTEPRHVFICEFEIKSPSQLVG